MTKVLEFLGTYKRAGSKIYLPTGSLLITTRPAHKRSHNKTSEYLLRIDEVGKRHYVSSLYQVRPDTYRLEYGRSWYLLYLSEISATIAPEN